MATFKTIRPWEPPKDHRPALRWMDRPIHVNQDMLSYRLEITDKFGRREYLPVCDVEQLRAVPGLYEIWINTASTFAVLR